MALDKKKAAWQLGVTEDMIDTALQIDKEDPNFNMSLKKYMGQGFGNEEKFWKELSTVEVLNEVRDRKMTIKDATFMFGVSRAKLKNKVGKVKSEKEIKIEKELSNEEKRKTNHEKKVKPPTQLEMQIKVAEDNIESLSAYDKMRLENLRERQAMLVSLNMAEDKKTLKVTPTEKSIPIDYGRRDKSSRIQRKKEEFQPVFSTNGVAGIWKPRKSPEWVGGWYPTSGVRLGTPLSWISIRKC